jgi:hypothetical protein
MKRKLLTIILATGVAALFVSASLYAGTEVFDVITMDYNKYTKRKYIPPKYNVFKFTHKIHMEEYEISCGECHHDENNKPLDLEIGDIVQQCDECHNIMEKTKENKRDIMVLENAIHENCRTCHKQINKEAGDPKGKKGPGPISCSKCHIKADKS